VSLHGKGRQLLGGGGSRSKYFAEHRSPCPEHPGRHGNGLALVTGQISLPTAKA
jgi:hypothetical protein